MQNGEAVFRVNTNHLGETLETWRHLLTCCVEEISSGPRIDRQPLRGLQALAPATGLQKLMPDCPRSPLETLHPLCRRW